MTNYCESMREKYSIDEVAYKKITNLITLSVLKLCLKVEIVTFQSRKLSHLENMINMKFLFTLTSTILIMTV